jgi:carboxypeptidase T
LEKLAQHNYSYLVLIDDMTHYYVERNTLPESQIDMHSGSLLSQFYPVPQGFSLGSLGGFCTYDEFLVHLDNLHTTYPNLITAKQPVSTTYSIENRPIYYVKIANNNQPGSKPKVLYTGMIHAREPIGMQHLLFMMYYLLENYNDDPEIQYIVDHAELYFVPVVNPDGYIHNEQIAPGGGGMWRKNRRNNGNGTFGVDLNRNFGYEWGYDNIGSSPNPSDDTYRGTHGFSEPETQVLKQLCESIPFTIALNYHSYSNLLLYSWGYTYNVTFDNDIFFNHSRLMTSLNGYVYGPSSSTIYLNNGGSDDWMYGEQTSKPKIFAYTPEVGSSSDGFWPSVNRIIPQCQENMYQSMMAALLSMKYASVETTGATIVSTFQNSFDFDIKRIGFQDGGVFTVSLAALSEEIISTGDPVAFYNMGFFETRSGSVNYELDSATAGGTALKFLLGIDNGHYVRYDTITKYYGLEEVAFFDDCNNLENWTGNWGLSNVHFVSPPSSITDSPSGNYPMFGSRTTTTILPISLADASAAFLNFKARWDINGNGAYVQVRISTGQGASWQAVGGKYSRPGIFSAVQGEPVYSDKQLSWVDETIDLSDYIGGQVLIRFHLSSSSWGTSTADGFYFDDLEVVMLTSALPVVSDFESDAVLVLEGSQIQFSDLSSGDPTFWEWDFPGGTPGTSSLPNPLVLYPNPGEFDVSLISGNSLTSDTIIKPAFVTVLDSVLCRPEVFAGADTTILPWETYTAVYATASNYSELTWTTTGDGTFTDNSILNPVYTPGTEDIANQKTELILTALPVFDICNSTSDTIELSIVDYTGIDFQKSNIPSVYPNPAGNRLYVGFDKQIRNGFLEILNMDGVVLKAIKLDGVAEIELNIESISQGIYLLKVSGPEMDFVKKLVVIR